CQANRAFVILVVNPDQPNEKDQQTVDNIPVSGGSWKATLVVPPGTPPGLAQLDSGCGTPDNVQMDYELETFCVLPSSCAPPAPAPSAVTTVPGAATTTPRAVATLPTATSPSTTPTTSAVASPPSTASATTTTNGACVVTTSPTGTVAAGTATIIHGSGCRTASEVGIQSTFTRLAAVTPDATGAFTVTVTIPSDTSRVPLGTHQIVVRADSAVVGSSPAFTVTAPAGGTSTGGRSGFPTTGSDHLPWVAVAVALLAVGQCLTLLRAPRVR
ncbi:MAG: hypothetical protein LC792_18480, partial [Actinobacteria bacterium]|nr:hypothetical protein [Actinomycetota bacterium]